MSRANISHDAHSQRIVKMMEGYRSVAYQDQGGVPTVGWGHTGGVTVGSRISPEEGERLFQLDWGHAQMLVLRHIKVPLEPWQLGALNSFVFNVGGGAFADSTLVRLLNEKRYAEAEDQFRLWCNVKGVPVAGLKFRRAIERFMWIGYGPQIDPHFFKIIRDAVR